MADANYKNNAIITEIPESVSRLVDALLKINVNIELESQADIPISQASPQEIIDIVGNTISELFDFGFVDNSRFIEKAKIVKGLFSTGFHTVFEYDKWYINPIYLFEKKSIKESVFIKKGNTPFLVMWNEPISSILAVLFGIYAEDNIGVDFTSKKWVTRLTKNESIYSLLIKFLLVDIANEDMHKLDKYDDLLLFDGPEDSSKHSLRISNLLIRTLTKIILSSEVLDERVDAFTDIFVAGGLSESAVYEYWIEFGEYYLITDYEHEQGIEIGLLKDFRRNKDLCFTFRDAINAHELYKQEFLYEIRKNMC